MLVTMLEWIRRLSAPAKEVFGRIGEELDPGGRNPGVFWVPTFTVPFFGWEGSEPYSNRRKRV